MKIAVEGCCHGELDNIYAALLRLQEIDNVKIDLLICCGDFQAVRDQRDMGCLTVPPKYRAMQDFHKYYTGQKKAPILTIFVGGNHEAPNYLRDLYYGGWVAPNIFYLGHSGVVKFGPLRIGGISGIFKYHDYHKGHFEIAPFNEESSRSAYHVREFEVLKLCELRESLDIFISHDWPKGVWRYGDYEAMLKKKDHNGGLRADIESNRLGNPGGEQVLRKVKPSFWFSAHLHCKFTAIVPHKDGSFTRFLALDKCLPNRDFLQILDIDKESPSMMRSAGDDSTNVGGDSSDGEAIPHKYTIDFDPEWLAIVKVNQRNISYSNEVKRPLVVAPSAATKELVVELLRNKVGGHQVYKPIPLEQSDAEPEFSEVKMKNYSVAELKALFDKRGLQFDGSLSKAALQDLLLQNVGADASAAAASKPAGQHGNDEVDELDEDLTEERFSWPQNFAATRKNPLDQRRYILDLLQLDDDWPHQWGGADEHANATYCPPVAGQKRKVGNHNGQGQEEIVDNDHLDLDEDVVPSKTSGNDEEIELDI